MDAIVDFRSAMPVRRIKGLVKKVLPPRATIHLIGLRNYLMGEAELHALRYLVDPQRGSIDVGCDRGVYAYFLSRLSRKVWCFEPHPASVAFLTAAFAGASNIAIYPIAASDRDAEVTLRIPSEAKTRLLNSSTISAFNPACDSTWESITVDARRLDSIIDTEIGFIKIDVEGHEGAVLDGGGKLLRKSRPNLVMEVERRHLGSDPAEVFERLLKLDYRGWFIWDGRLLPIDRFDCEVHQQVANLTIYNTRYANNFIFTPREYRAFPPPSWRV
jgi:FkbM family methyltransferase